MWQWISNARTTAIAIQTQTERCENNKFLPILNTTLRRNLYSRIKEMESTTMLLKRVKFQVFIALGDYIFVIGFGLLQSGLFAK